MARRRYDGHFRNTLQAALTEGHEKTFQLLIETGANVNAQGGNYGNALQAASFRGHEKVVQLLLEKGADVNAQGDGHFSSGGIIGRPQEDSSAVDREGFGLQRTRWSPRKRFTGGIIPRP